MNAAPDFSPRRAYTARPKPSLAVVASAEDYVVDKPSTIEEQGKQLLTSWAIKTAGGVRLGYPSCSAEQRSETGGVMSAPSDLTADDERTDKAIAQMRMRHRSIHYRVIELWFIDKIAMADMIKILKVSRTEGYRMLNKACGAFWRFWQTV